MSRKLVRKLLCQLVLAGFNRLQLSVCSKGAFTPRSRTEYATVRRKSAY